MRKYSEHDLLWLGAVMNDLKPAYGISMEVMPPFQGESTFF